MSRTEACTADRFAQDIARHTMTVLRDDGVDRHLRFKRPNDSSYWFDVITWGGRFYIGGDCGTYVFTRIHDMFEFFRQSGNRINPQYWAQKLAASDGPFERFEWSTFLSDVKEDFEQSNVIDPLEPDPFPHEQKEYDDAIARRTAIWAEIQEKLSNAEDDQAWAWTFLRDFEHLGYSFTEWERTSKEYDFHYLWNCHAIVWAIAQYDAHKAAQVQASAEVPA